MKVIAVTFICFVLAIFLYIYFAPKYISAQIVDDGYVALPGIQVTISEVASGFDETGHLIFNKPYVYTGITDTAGKFRIKYYRGGPTLHLHFDMPDDVTGPGLKDLEMKFWEHPVIEYRPNGK